MVGPLQISHFWGVLLAGAAAVMPVTGQEAAATWKVEPLVALNSPLPGGGTALELGDVHPLGEGAFAFWAKAGEKQWVLCRWKAGRMERVLQERVEFKPPGCAAPSTIQYSIGGMTVPTASLAGSKTLFLEARGGFRPNAILEVTDTAVRKVVAEGDPGPQGSTVEKVQLGNVDGGWALVRIVTGKPHKGSQWVLWDGGALRPVIASGDEIVPGQRVKGDVASSLLPDQRPILDGDRVWLPVGVEGAPFPCGFFEFAPGGNRRLLALNDPIPGGQGTRVFQFGPFMGVGPGKAVVQLESKGEGFMSLKTGLYLLSLDGLQRVLSKEEIHKRIPGLQRMRWSAFPAGPRILLHLVATAGQGGGEFQSINHVFYLTDGVRTQEVLLPPKALPIGYPKGGGRALALWTEYLRPTSKPGGGTGYVVPLFSEGGKGASLWFDPQQPEAFREPPTLPTDQGAIHLGMVAAWLDEDRAVIRREGGLALCRRLKAGKPAGTRQETAPNP